MREQTVPDGVRADTVLDNDGLAPLLLQPVDEVAE